MTCSSGTDVSPVAQFRDVEQDNSKHASRYTFFGATGSTEFSGLTPGESWKRLKNKTPGHVGREVLNFKQDHWKPIPTPSHESRRR